MTRASDAIVALLQGAGVECVFGFPYEQTDPYYASVDASNLKHVLARSEASAALMADGYARSARSVGVVDGVGVLRNRYPRGRAIPITPGRDGRRTDSADTPRRRRAAPDARTR